MKTISRLVLVGIIGLSVAGTGHAASDAGPAAPVSAVGVVQQVKPAEGKVKIAHDAIPALGWPQMTMYFRVRDRTVLESVGSGDKVRFVMEKDDQGFVIARIEKVDK